MMFIIGTECISNDTMHTISNYPFYRKNSMSIQRVRIHSYISPRQTLIDKKYELISEKYVKWWEYGNTNIDAIVYVPSNVEPWMDACCECEYYEKCDGQMCFFAEV